MDTPVFLPASQILARLLTVDSDNSGLNANTLQGYAASAFSLAGHTHGGGGGTPGGSDTQMQFNDGGAFGGDAGFVFNKTTKAARLTSGSDYIDFGFTSGNPTISLFNAGQLAATITSIFPALAFNTGASFNGAITTTAAFEAPQLTAKDASNPYVRAWKTGQQFYDWSAATNGRLRLLDHNGEQLATFSMGSAAGGNLCNGLGSNTHTAAWDIPASTTARASLRIRNGVRPTSPNAGDINFDGTNIEMYIGGAWKIFTLV